MSILVERIRGCHSPFVHLGAREQEESKGEERQQDIRTAGGRTREVAVSLPQIGGFYAFWSPFLQTMPSPKSFPAISKVVSRGDRRSTH
jgi:hypothetical protein